jgi:cation diffusion facilitator CzcD-associated flavoprotein CzcO
MPANRVSGKGLSVGIIGAGPGGLALGIVLRKGGFADFTIFDREDGVGGTWRINTYPGLACDVKSHLYSYSFDLNANWSRMWSGQPEILEYFDRCAPSAAVAAQRVQHRGDRERQRQDAGVQGHRPAYASGIDAAPRRGDLEPGALVARAVTLRETWRDGAYAYLGMAIPGFPTSSCCMAPTPTSAPTA